MSNVLIGIIGVILFIGLAVAGAVFFGPRLMQSSDTSKASAAIHVVTKIALAAQQRQYVEESRATGVGQLVAENYLRGVPVNPTGPTATYLISYNPTYDFVTMRIGGNSEAICKAAMKQLRGTEIIETGVTGENGCYGNGTDYWIYQRT